MLSNVGLSHIGVECQAIEHQIDSEQIRSLIVTVKTRILYVRRGFSCLNVGLDQLESQCQREITVEASLVRSVDDERYLISVVLDHNVPTVDRRVALQSHPKGSTNKTLQNLRFKAYQWLAAHLCVPIEEARMTSFADGNEQMADTRIP